MDNTIEKIEAPERVNLKRVNLIRTSPPDNVGRTVITQRRIYRNHEWSVEPTSVFLERVREASQMVEGRGEEIHQVTSSSFKANGEEMVQLEIPDLMNRVFVLDYLTAAMMSDDIKVTDDYFIRFGTIGEQAQDLAHKQYMSAGFFSEVWMPSATAEQAMFLQVLHDLSTTRVKNTWEVSHDGNFKHPNPNSTLAVEILRTAIRKHFANRPVLIPTSVFLKLGGPVIHPNQPNYSTENY